MNQITVDEASELLEAATVRYRDVEQALAEPSSGETTPERLLRNVELQGALHDAAQDLIEAKKSFDLVAAETAERRRERAEAELAGVETALLGLIAKAEHDIETLHSSLLEVLLLSKKRYAYRQEATGRAPRSFLARDTVHGWLSWRLQALELPGLDSPPHHYRAPLAELLGLTPELDDQGDH